MTKIKSNQETELVRHAEFFVDFCAKNDGVPTAMINETVRELKWAAKLLLEHKRPMKALLAADSISWMAEDSKDTAFCERASRFLSQTTSKAVKAGALESKDDAQKLLTSLAIFAAYLPPESKAGQILTNAWKRNSVKVAERHGYQPLINAIIDAKSDAPHPFLPLASPTLRKSAQKLAQQ